MEIIVCKCPALWEHWAELLKGTIYSNWVFFPLGAVNLVFESHFYSLQNNESSKILSMILKVLSNSSFQGCSCCIMVKKNNWQQFVIVILVIVIQALLWHKIIRRNSPLFSPFSKKNVTEKGRGEEGKMKKKKKEKCKYRKERILPENINCRNVSVDLFLWSL